jgi:hypothetical protein
MGDVRQATVDGPNSVQVMTVAVIPATATAERPLSVNPAVATAERPVAGNPAVATAERPVIPAAATVERQEAVIPAAASVCVCLCVFFPFSFFQNYFFIPF